MFACYQKRQYFNYVLKLELNQGQNCENLTIKQCRLPWTSADKPRTKTLHSCWNNCQQGWWSCIYLNSVLARVLYRRQLHGYPSLCVAVDWSCSGQSGVIPNVRTAEDCVGWSGTGNNVSMCLQSFSSAWVSSHSQTPHFLYGPEQPMIPNVYLAVDWLTELPNEGPKKAFGCSCTGTDRTWCP